MEQSVDGSLEQLGYEIKMGNVYDKPVNASLKVMNDETSVEEHYVRPTRQLLPQEAANSDSKTESGLPATGHDKVRKRRTSSVGDYTDPRKISEQFSEMFDIEWVEVNDHLRSSRRCNEEEACEVLLNLICSIYKVCAEKAESDLRNLLSAMKTFTGEEVSKDIIRYLNERRILNSKTHMHYLKQILREQTLTILPEEAEKQAGCIKAFINRGLQLCWLMVISEPPVYMDTLTDQKHDTFNNDTHTQYSNPGPFLDFIVWPTLYDGKDGQVLCRGIAKCKPDMTRYTFDDDYIKQKGALDNKYRQTDENRRTAKDDDRLNKGVQPQQASPKPVKQPLNLRGRETDNDNDYEERPKEKKNQQMCLSEKQSNLPDVFMPSELLTSTSFNERSFYIENLSTENKPSDTYETSLNADQVPDEQDANLTDVNQTRDQPTQKSHALNETDSDSDSFKSANDKFLPVSFSLEENFFEEKGNEMEEKDQNTHIQHPTTILQAHSDVQKSVSMGTPNRSLDKEDLIEENRKFGSVFHYYQRPCREHVHEAETFGNKHETTYDGADMLRNEQIQNGQNNDLELFGETYDLSDYEECQEAAEVSITSDQKQELISERSAKAKSAEYYDESEQISNCNDLTDKDDKDRVSTELGEQTNNVNVSGKHEAVEESITDFTENTFSANVEKQTNEDSNEGVEFRHLSTRYESLYNRAAKSQSFGGYDKQFSLERIGLTDKKRASSPNRYTTVQEHERGGNIAPEKGKEKVTSDVERHSKPESSVSVELRGRTGYYHDAWLHRNTKSKSVGDFEKELSMNKESLPTPVLETSLEWQNPISQSNLAIFEEMDLVSKLSFEERESKWTPEDTKHNVDNSKHSEEIQSAQYEKRQDDWSLENKRQNEDYLDTPVELRHKRHDQTYLDAMNSRHEKSKSVGHYEKHSSPAVRARHSFSNFNTEFQLSTPPVVAASRHHSDQHSHRRRALSDASDRAIRKSSLMHHGNAKHVQNKDYSDTQVELRHKRHDQTHTDALASRHAKARSAGDYEKHSSPAIRARHSVGSFNTDPHREKGPHGTSVADVSKHHHDQNGHRRRAFSDATDRAFMKVTLTPKSILKSARLLDEDGKRVRTTSEASETKSDASAERSVNSVNHHISVELRNKKDDATETRKSLLDIDIDSISLMSVSNCSLHTIHSPKDKKQSKRKSSGAQEGSLSRSFSVEKETTSVESIQATKPKEIITDI